MAISPRNMSPEHIALGVEGDEGWVCFGDNRRWRWGSRPSKSTVAIFSDCVIEEVEKSRLKG